MKFSLSLLPMGRSYSRKTPTECLQTSLALLLKCRTLYCWSRKPEFYKTRSHLWHSNLMKSTGLPRLDFFQDWGFIVPRLIQCEFLADKEWWDTHIVQLQGTRSFLQCFQGLALTFEIIRKSTIPTFCPCLNSGFYITDGSQRTKFSKKNKQL